MRHTLLLSIFALSALLLSGCGGGGSGAANQASGTTPPTAAQLIEAAVNSGDPAQLQDAHLPALLQGVAKESSAVRDRQLGALRDIYSGVTDLTLNHTTSSQRINISRQGLAAPLIIADNDAGMAGFAQIGTGRGLVYGADALGWMAGTTREQQHLPLFNRAFSWLVTGKANGPLPATLKVATAGYNVNTVKAYLTRVGSATTALTCAVADTANTCWRDADVLVFGQGATNSDGLRDLVRSYLDAGKPVLYMQSNWVTTDGGVNVVSAMGMALGGYPGNYFAPAAGVSVGAGRTVQQVLDSVDILGPLLNLLPTLEKMDLVQDFKADPSLLKVIDTLHNALATQQAQGIDVFKEADTRLYRYLVLWADVVRRGVVYGGSLSSTGTAAGNTATFLRTYASDSWLAFNRSSTTAPPQGSGDFMPAAAAKMAVSASFETIEVTIPQASGITLIGRAAVPAKGVVVQVEDSAGAGSLGLQTNYVRAWGDAVADKVYAHPRRPQSFRILLPKTGDTHFVTPFGGPLVLAYSGATPGTVIKLRIKGAAKYAHFDFSRTPSQAEIDEASAALKLGDFGWQTNKFVGGEVQQLTKFAQDAMGTLTPQEYVVGRLKGILFDSNHYANGYDNMPISAQAQALCDSMTWTCTGSLHRAPNVQHFIGWIATCGWLCSGNPSDGFTGVGSGWGHAHELGHNTVQRVMHIAPNGVGCVVECDNNILASATMLRQYAMLGIDTGHALDHPGLYADIVANRATGLSGEALRAEMEKRLWGGGQDAMRAVHFQLAFLYAKQRLNLSQPTMDSTLEFFQLLTKTDRLVANAWDANNKSKYGMGRFADNKIGNEDLLYVLSSKIVGRDLRQQFAMVGIPLTQTALDSIADLGLPQQALSFYALATGKHNQLATGTWVDLAGQTPAYPF